MQHGQTHGAPDELHHEESDVDIRAILRFGAVAGRRDGRDLRGRAGWCSASSIDVRRLTAFATSPSPSSRSELPPQPRLQIAPRQDLRALRQRDEALLNSYGWADREAGLVRIPIAEAMRLTVERGLPVRSTRTGRAPVAHARRGAPVTRRSRVGSHGSGSRRAAALTTLCRHDRAGADDWCAVPRLPPRRGTPASTIPAPLREIGFDQKIDEQLPLDVELRGRTGPPGPSRRVLRHAGPWSWHSSTTTARCSARRC